MPPNGRIPNCRPKTALAQIFREQKQLAEEMQSTQSGEGTAVDAADPAHTQTAATQALFAHLPFHTARSTLKGPAESAAAGLEKPTPAKNRQAVELQTADSFIHKFAASNVAGASFHHSLRHVYCLRCSRTEVFHWAPGVSGGRTRSVRWPVTAPLSFLSLLL